jgi:hypothetical protein
VAKSAGNSVVTIGTTDRAGALTVQRVGSPVAPEATHN